jgi:predicted permease
MALMRWLHEAREDLWFGCRRLTRDLDATTAVVLVLACGIGLSVAMFAVADTILRRPLPVLDQERVVVLWGEAGGSMRTLPLTPQHFERFRNEARTLQEVAGTLSIDSWAQPVRDGEQTFRVNLSPVTGNFFVVLGSKAVLGRTLVPDDDHPGAAPVAVLSYSLWRGQFAGNPAVLGRRLELRNSRVVTVVGVAPPGLEYPAGTEIWVPFANLSAVEVMPMGRLSSQATAQEAAAELRASFEREPKSEWPGLRGAAVPLPSLILGEVRPALLLLTAAASVLLLTACFNVSNLLLLRGAARQQEIAVRQALGASHGRIMRLLLVEALPLGLLGSLVGAGVATALVRVLVALAPANTPRLEEVGLQGVPLGLAVLVGCAAALGSGVMPALWLSRDVPLLHSGGRNTTAPRNAVFAQRAMVIFQMGLAVFVLFVAGLLGRTLQTLHAIDTGLAVDHVALVELSLPDTKFASGERVAAMYESLLPRIKALPGVTSAATVNVVPFTGATSGWDGPFVADGQSSRVLVFNFAVVGTEYFETMGVRLRSGRAFDRNDRRGSAPVAMVSEQAARLLGVENGAIGRRIRLSERPGEWRTIVGVAAETRYRAIRESAPTVYLPLGQFTEVMTLITSLVVRTDGRPAAAIPSIRDVVAQTDPDVTILHAAPLDDLVSGQLAGPRLNAVLLSVFGAGTALLAAAGLYSLLAASVKARRRELAIRQAIGATPARLRRIVVVQAVWLCGVGLAFGLAGGLAFGRLLATVLYGVAPNDLYTVVGVVVVLIITSVAATYVPARRATRSDLIALLRDAYVASTQRRADRGAHPVTSVAGAVVNRRERLWRREARRHVKHVWLSSAKPNTFHGSSPLCSRQRASAVAGRKWSYLLHLLTT